MNINKETLRLYWRQTRRHKPSFFLALFAIPIGAAVIDSLLPYVLSGAIGAIGNDDHELMKAMLMWGAVVGIVGACLNLIGFQALVRHEASVTKDLREDTFVRLINKDNNFFVNQKIGAMTSRYIDFVRSNMSIRDLLIIRTLGFVMTVGTGLTILAFNSLLVALMVLGLIVLLILEIRWSIKKRGPWRHERKRLVSEIHGAVADSLTNNLVVRTFAGEDDETRKLNSLTSRFSKIFKKDIGFLAAEGSARVLLMIIVQVASIAVSATMVSAGKIDLAAAIFILAYMQRIGSQLFTLGDIIGGYDQALLEAQPMTEMLLVDDKVVDDPNAKQLRMKSPSVSFQSASFRYLDGESDVVSDLNIEIPAGQKVGLVGPSGAGKSTIVQLLLRFSDVTSGAILVDGHDVRQITQKSLRENIAYVPQEPMLFHRTLRKNIAYGNAEASDEDIMWAVRQANAAEFVSKMPHGLDTIVGERGIKLSGGQRQRIAIARAILKDAPILLLDEATSALDSQSEKYIQQSLDQLMNQRTSIVVAHRLSTIAKLDRIIVLDGGRVVEDGSHGQLIQKGGIYASLWSHQSGGFIED